MAAKGYCTPDDVATLLGLKFSVPQETYAKTLIEQAEGTVDRETGRAWLMGARTNERHEWQEYRLGDLYLRYAPVDGDVALTITGRSGLGADEVTLVADTDYEVIDLEAGQIRVIAPCAWDRLLVSYSQASSIPGPISRATAELVAAWMQPNLEPGSYGMESVQLPDLQFRRSPGQLDTLIPDSVQRALDLLRYPVHA